MRQLIRKLPVRRLNQNTAYNIPQPLILRKKLGELQEKLTAKKVEMTLTDEAFDYLLKEGFTKEDGAREMDRVITGKLKPLLMREILFGSLRKGGKITITQKELEI